MLVKDNKISAVLTVLAGLRPGSDLPVLNEAPAHDRDAPAQFSAVCSCTQALVYQQQYLLHAPSFFFDLGPVFTQQTNLPLI